MPVWTPTDIRSCTCEPGTSIRPTSRNARRIQTAERHAFEALPDEARRPLVLATAPGYGRPRPHRLGEANGLNVVRWTPAEIEVETRIWRDGAFGATALSRIYRL